MVLVANGVVWMDVDPGEGQDTVSWTRNSNSNSNSNSNNGEIETNYHEIQGRVEELAMAGSLPTFKSMLDSDWYVNQDFRTQPEVRELGFCANPAENSLILHHPLDSSASCSPSQGQPSALDPSQSHLFFPQKSCFASLFDVPGSNPFDNAFDFASETSFLAHLQPNPGSNLVGFSQNQMGNHEFNLAPDVQLIRPDGASCLESGFNVGGIEKFDGSESNGLFTNRDKRLKPLEVFPSIGSPPTLFQKRPAMRQSSGDKLDNMEIPGIKKNRNIEKGEIEGASIEISGVNYDSEERNVDSKVEDGTNTGGSYSNANSKVAGADQKGGKKKGMPAKNLMAERRRRKKVNDRLFMLRTAVPRISKMDRASILGDAIDYLKELLQRINDLHNELESNPPVPPVAPSTSFYPLTPTPSTLSCRVKEELCPSLFPSPKNQPAKVEVRAREGGAVNIHMFCARRPGLLVSTMSALDNLGLDIQQAVISCFNGFSLDVFRAELCREGQDVLPEQIKAVLLDSAGFHGMV